MAAAKTRTPDQIRREIEIERERLATALEALRGQIDDATDLGARLRSKLPLVTTGALAAGFVAAGGFGATMRLLARRSREGRRKAQLGRFTVVDHR